jgi:DNA repair protein RecO (recombination protein O)
VITKTDAVVLKAMKYRDTSKIVTFYTRRFGKLKGIAKGARQLRNKFGSSLDPLSQVCLVLYKKEQRDLHLISQCDLRNSPKETRSNLEKMAVGLAVLELVDQVAHEEEGHEALYSLLSETLDAVEIAERNVLNLYFSFVLRCSALLGFLPDVESCSGCDRTLEQLEAERSVFFRLSSGGILCPSCAESGKEHGELRNVRLSELRMKNISTTRGEERVRVSIGAVRVLSFLLRSPLATVTSLALGSETGNEIDGTLRLYMRQHFENMKPVKALDLLRKFNTAGS